MNQTFKFLKPFIIGLSGFIPTIFAIIQGVDPTETCEQDIHNMSLNGNSSSGDTIFETKIRFSAEVFFASLLVTLMISWSALILLQSLPVCKRESKLQIILQSNDMELKAKLRGESLENCLSLITPKSSDINQEFKANRPSVRYDKIQVQLSVHFRDFHFFR